MSRFIQLSLVFLLVAACGGSGGDDTPTDSPATTGTTPTTSTVDESTSITEAEPADSSTTSSSTVTPTTVGTTTTSELAGEEMEAFGPVAGTVLAVFGVAHDDVLNVRAAPGTDQPIVAELDPLEDRVTALGHTRQMTSSIWYEIEVGDNTGWAASRFLFQMGGTDDLTSLVVERAGAYPEAETMLALGVEVAKVLADPEASTFVMSVPPSMGDLGEVTYDLAGLGDDSLWGWRLHVFGAPTEGGEGFSLKSVEATIFCIRAVDDGGSCV